MVASYTFGSYALDPGQRRLLRDGQPVDVHGRYFDALRLMVANPGQLVSKERFNAEVWRGVPVTDEALTQCIRSLRRALGDDASAPRFIETVPRHGYRFIAPVGGARGPAGGRAPRLAAIAAEAGAAALGGAVAGIIGGIVYVTAGLVSPGLGAASIALALISLCLGLGLLGGLAIGLGVAIAGGRGNALARSMLGGALGGLGIGALATIVGRDLMTLLFGKAPDTFTGAPEAALLGAAVGAATHLAARGGGGALGPRFAPAALIGLGAGLAIHLANGRLLAGSLAELGRSFPDSPLRFGALTAPMLGGAAALEAGLFTICVAAALVLARRLRDA